MILPLSSCAQQTVKVDDTAIPETFSNAQENNLQGAENISRFFSKLESGETQARVLHIGDSHVRGHYFPGNVRKALEQSFGAQAMGDDPIGYNLSAIATETGQPGLVFSAIGVNGAQAHTFLKPELLQQIAAQRPDLVIMSFGTNEAYGNKYSAERHAANLDRLVAAIRECCGDSVEFLLTTPPGCMKKVKADVKRNNPFNGEVASAIVSYALRNNMAVWDMYTVCGGDKSACSNWQAENLLRPDGVHFTPAGYKLQGRLLGQAIAKAFNER